MNTDLRLLLPDTTDASALEKTTLELGFIPLTDCAPLAVAQELGFFEEQGLHVRLSREPSWANIRDKVCFGLLDGAQMLAGMPLATSLGAETFRRPLITGLSLSLNGNAITVSDALYREIEASDPVALKHRPITAACLKPLIERRVRDGAAPLRFASVFPSSSHNFLLRYWLAAAGIDPDQDVALCVVPPPQLPDQLEQGRVDGYCVGEPWNSRAVAEGFGRVLITSYDIWNNHPEKVFGVTRDWAETHPNTHLAVLTALLQAGRWLDEPVNRTAAAQLLAHQHYVGVPAELIAQSLTGQIGSSLDDAAVQPDFHVFHRYAANLPWLSHGEWLIGQMCRWGQLKGPLKPRAAAASVYRPELYRAAASRLGWPVPPLDRKPEGFHDDAWEFVSATRNFRMGPDRFFDGSRIDPNEIPDADPTAAQRATAAGA